MEVLRPKGQMIVLQSFFGRLSGQTLREFGAEVNALDVEEKLELAQLAAVELGLAQDNVTFPLS